MWKQVAIRQAVRGILQRGWSELAAKCYCSSDFPAAGVPFSLTYPSRRHPAPRTRLVMDFIWERVRQIRAELATASDEGRIHLSLIGFDRHITPAVAGLEGVLACYFWRSGA